MAKHPATLSYVFLLPLLAGTGIHCGPPLPACSADCPAIGGQWNLVTDFFAVTGKCSWYNVTGTSPMSIDQPGAGSSVNLTVQYVTLINGQFPLQNQLALNGTLREDGSLAANAPFTLSAYGTVSTQETDSVDIRFTGSTAFRGTWTTTLIQTDSSQQPATSNDCTRSATIHGYPAGP